jgi:hypothetical protein
MNNLVNFKYCELSINQKINLKSNIIRQLYICYDTIKNGNVRFKYTLQPKLK